MKEFLFRLKKPTFATETRQPFIRPRDHASKLSVEILSILNNCTKNITQKSLQKVNDL